MGPPGLDCKGRLPFFSASRRANGGARGLCFSSGVPFSILVPRLRLRDLSRIEHTLEFPLSGISVGLLPYSIQTCGIIILYGGGGASLPSCPFRLLLLSQVGPVTLGLLNEFLTTPTQRREICLFIALGDPGWR